MKKALVILNDGSMVECEYIDAEERMVIMGQLEDWKFTRFASDTLRSDTIARIEWID